MIHSNSYGGRCAQGLGTDGAGCYATGYGDGTGAYNSDGDGHGDADCYYDGDGDGRRPQDYSEGDDDLQ